MPPIELWSRLPPPESVGTEQLIDGAVTTPKIADGAVTSTKVSQGLRSEHVLGDDTEVKTNKSTYEVMKLFNLYKNTTVESFNWTVIQAVVEGRVDTSGATGYVAFFVNDETTPRKEFAFTSTTYTLLMDSFDISDLSTGLHAIKISMRVTAGHVYNRHLEIKALK